MYVPLAELNHRKFHCFEYPIAANFSALNTVMILSSFPQKMLPRNVLHSNLGLQRVTEPVMCIDGMKTYCK